MAWFRKKNDPISDRARALSTEIADLEARIKKLDSRVQRGPQPRLRSTAIPHGETLSHALATAAEPTPEEPIFEDMDSGRLASQNETPATPQHFN